MTPPCIRIGAILVVLSSGGCRDDVGVTDPTTTSDTTHGETTSGDSTSPTEGSDTAASLDTSGVGTDTADASSGGIDTPPLANDDVFYVLAGDELVVSAAGGVLANDVDPEGDAIVIVDADAMSDSGASVVVAADGSVSFMPADGFWGSDTFGYTIADPSGAMSTAVVTVHVAPRRIPFDEVANGHGGFVFVGEASGSTWGISVDGAGDVDGDGRGDLVVGAHHATGGAASSGRGYVVFGPPDTDPIAISDVERGTGGFVIDGATQDSFAGFSVNGAGDVNGDGDADVIIGAGHGAYGDPGEHVSHAYVVFGKDDGTIALADVEAGIDGFAIVSAEPGDSVGRSVSGAGDVNGDGLDDVIVGAPNATVEAFGDGKAYVVFGTVDTTPISCADLEAGVGGFVISGEPSRSWLGLTLGGGGDVDGDGLADLVISDPGAINGGPGRAYVVFGKGDTAAVDLVEIAAGNGGGFSLIGESGVGDYWWSASEAGDVDGDGRADILIGAGYFDNLTGRTYVVFGKDDSQSVSLAEVAQGDGGFVIDASMADAFAGEAVAAAGDVNADGLGDVILGARGEQRVYVVYGKDDGDVVSLSDIADGAGGFTFETADVGVLSVGGAGDVDGDGVSDIVVGWPDPPNEDRSYVVFGVPTGP